MNETQKQFIARLKADAESARNRAKRLAFLSDIIGPKEFMLKQAKSEEDAAAGYDQIANYAAEQWSK